MSDDELGGLLAAVLVPALLGAVFVGIGILRGRMSRGWTRTTGMVVNKDGSTHGWPSQYPTFRWVDQHGIEHQHTSMVRASLGPRPGKLVTVRYDPSSPDRAVIDSFAQSGRIFLWIGLAILIVWAIVGGYAMTFYLALR